MNPIYGRTTRDTSTNPCLPSREKFIDISNSYEILNRRVALQLRV